MSSDRQALIDKMQAEMEQVRLQIEKLQARAQEVEADARLDMQKQIQALRDKRDDAAARLKQWEESGASATDDLRSGAERAWREMSSAAERAAQRFS